MFSPAAPHGGPVPAEEVHLPALMSLFWGLVLKEDDDKVERYVFSEVDQIVF